MKVPLSKRYLSLGLTCAFLSLSLLAEASESDDTTTITLEKAVHFIGTDGNDVVANFGEYSVEAAQE